MEAVFHLLHRLDSRMSCSLFPPPPTTLLSGLRQVGSSLAAAPGGRRCGSRLDHWGAAQSQTPLELDFWGRTRFQGGLSGRGNGGLHSRIFSIRHCLSDQVR